MTHIRTLLHQLRRAFESTEGISAQRGGVRFTERERRVLSFVFEGLANKQIADRLQISESAGKASLQQLFTKTGVRTRSQLVRIALEKYRDL
ncbi:MAG TPA: helix-turn-helix transcriptional regulator [Terriglobales bacterium]|nr:helix-turn-helix transcriptional regulator [Terriglobales bacterium]